MKEVHQVIVAVPGGHDIVISEHDSYEEARQALRLLYLATTSVEREEDE